MASVTPFLCFDTDLTEAIAFYLSILPDSTWVDGPRPSEAGPIHSAVLEIAGQRLNLLNGGPVNAGFTEAISLMIAVDTQAEIDAAWERLTSDGGEPGRCGWCKDRYGLSWQVVPSTLGSLLGSPDRVRADRAHAAMLQMGKLDLAALQAAYDG